MSRAEPVTDVSLGTIPTAPVNLPGVPVSMPVTVSSDPADSEATGNLISPTGATVGFKFCVPDFREGCYQIAIATGISVFGDRYYSPGLLHGTLLIFRPEVR